MSCDDGICSGLIELAGFDGGCGGSKDKPVDAISTCGDRGKSRPANLDMDSPRQSRHPSPRAGIKLGGGMGKPGGRQSFTLAPFGKAAAAIRPTRSKALLAISHHNVTSAVAQELNRCRRVGAIGHDVTGTDGTPGRNAERCRAIEQRPGCFQVAVRTAEEQQRSIGPNGFFRFDHIRLVAFGAALARLPWVSAAKRKRLTIFCMLSRRRETRGKGGEAF